MIAASLNRLRCAGTVSGRRTRTRCRICLDRSRPRTINLQIGKGTLGEQEAEREQALELQAQFQQDQAAEMELQQAELEQQADELRMANDELAQTNAAFREAREAAELSEKNLFAILSAIADPFVVHDRDWRFRYVNEAAGRVFSNLGMGDEPIVGRNVWELYPGLIGTAFDREMRRAQVERVPVVFEDFFPETGTWSEQRCYQRADG